MELRPGSRLRSPVCDTEVIVVRAPKTAVVMECGGHPMAPVGDDRPGGLSIDPARAAGTLLGKRYADEAKGLEVLCTKAGEGSLSLDGEPLTVKEAKPLPSSD